MVRVSFEELSHLHDELDTQFVGGHVAADTYLQEWDEILLFSGWTMSDYIQEVDRRWIIVPVMEPHLSVN